MGIKRSHELKQLQSQKAKLEIELKQTIEEKRNAIDKHSRVIIKLKNIEDRISCLTCDTVIISEHAILRYIEKQMGIDLKKIENKILTEKLISQIQTIGNGKYPIGGNSKLKAVVKDRTIITLSE